MHSEEAAVCSEEDVVAVIMSVYHGDDPKKFERALCSLTNQTIFTKQVRIYLYVDGPVQSSIAAIILRRRTIFHRVIRADVNHGLAYALNRLIEALEDERFVARMDSDDYSLPNRLERQIVFLKRKPDHDLCGTGIRETYGNGVQIERTYPGSPGDVRRKLTYGSPFAHVTVMFRRGFFKKFGSYPLSTRQNEDLGLFTKALCEGAIGSNLSEPLVEVTMGRGAIGRRSFTKGMDEFRIQRDYLISCRHSCVHVIWPFLKLLFRSLPARLQNIGYKLRLRTRLLNS